MSQQSQKSRKEQKLKGQKAVNESNGINQSFSPDEIIEKVIKFCMSFSIFYYSVPLFSFRICHKL